MTVSRKVKNVKLAEKYINAYISKSNDNQFLIKKKEKLLKEFQERMMK